MRKITLDRFIYFIIGAFVFSRFSAYLLLDLLKFPLFLPEILFVTFLPYFYRSNKCQLQYIKKKGKKTLIVLMIVWVLLVIISFVFNEYGVRYIVSTSRGYLHIILSFIVGRYLLRLNLDLLYYLCLGSVISAFVWLLFNDVGFKDVYYVNLSCIFLLILIVVIKGQISRLIYIIPILIYVSVMSGLRRAIFVIIFALLIGTVHTLIASRKFKLKFYILSFIAILTLSFRYVVDIVVNVLSKDEYLFKRIVVKNVELIFGGGSKGDNIRFNLISDIGSYISNSLFPRGYLTKNPDLTNSGMFMDIPIYELLYTFSSFLTVPFLLIVIYKTIKTYRKYKLSKVAVIPIFISLLFIFLFLDGGFLFWFYQTVFTGFFLGLLFNNNLHQKMYLLDKVEITFLSNSFMIKRNK